MHALQRPIRFEADRACWAAQLAAASPALDGPSAREEEVESHLGTHTQGNGEGNEDRASGGAARGRPHRQIGGLRHALADPVQRAAAAAAAARSAVLVKLLRELRAYEKRNTRVEKETHALVELLRELRALTSVREAAAWAAAARGCAARGCAAAADASHPTAAAARTSAAGKANDACRAVAERAPAAATAAAAAAAAVSATAPAASAAACAWAAAEKGRSAGRHDRRAVERFALGGQRPRGGEAGTSPLTSCGRCAKPRQPLLRGNTPATRATATPALPPLLPLLPLPLLPLASSSTRTALS